MAQEEEEEEEEDEVVVEGEIFVPKAYKVTRRECLRGWVGLWALGGHG